MRLVNCVDADGRWWGRCADCETPYFVSRRVQAEFARKGFPLPRRCWPCRQRRRLAKEIERYEQKG